MKQYETWWAAHLDPLRAVPKSALRERAGRLAPRRIAELKRALGYALGWTELTTSSGRTSKPARY